MTVCNTHSDNCILLKFDETHLFCSPEAFIVIDPIKYLYTADNWWISERIWRHKWHEIDENPFICDSSQWIIFNKVNNTYLCCRVGLGDLLFTILKIVLLFINMASRHISQE